MLNSSPSAQTRYRSVLRELARMWRQWIGVPATQPLEAAPTGSGVGAELTHDTGIAACDLAQPVRRGPNEANLLERRMAALDLDPYELTLGEPALFRHFQRRCMLCESWPRCLQDLAPNAEGSARQGRGWLEYCPNAATLEMLSALKKPIEVTPEYSIPYLGT